MTAGRRWVAALAVALAGGIGSTAIILATRGGSSGCADAVVPAAAVPAVFASPDAPVVRTDGELPRLVGALETSGFGRVLGAVPFDQSHYLHTAALADGFATWTRDNAVVGFRSRTGTVRWGLRQTTDPQAFAVVERTFVNLDLRPHAPGRAVAYQDESGRAVWCADIAATRVGDPLTVAAGAADSTWLVSAGPTLTHLDARGRVTARAPRAAIDRGAFVRQVGSLVVVGGRAAWLLTAPDPRIPGSKGPALAALDAVTLRPRWTWGRGVQAHVLGDSGGLVVVEVARARGLSLVALDLAGRERWSVALPAGTTADMALIRPWGTVLVRSDRSLAAYDARNGSTRWTRSLAATAAFPDGFDLSTQPVVGNEALIGARSALVTVAGDGRIKRYPLPEQGSDFWPYEMAVSGREAIVETDAGAVLVALRPGV